MTDPEQITEKPGEPAVVDDHQAHRFGIVLAVVALWMALGLGFKLDANQYLLLGFPLTVAFQLFMSRRPLWALWVREAPRLRITPGWGLTTIATHAFIDGVRNAMKLMD